MCQPIKNIIFDFGNVLIDLNIPRTTEKFQELLQEEFEASFAKSHAAAVFDRYEVGHLTEEEFVAILQQSTNRSITPQQVLEAWNGMLVGIPAHRLTLLERLRNDYKVFLLSNTNATHLDWVDAHLQAEHKMTMAEFNERFFDKTYYSHLIRLRKPGREIYDFVLNDAGLKAEETLFIDDNADNIEGAKLAGLQTILHSIGAEIVDVLEEQGFFKPIQQ